jgi:amino acid permease
MLKVTSCGVGFCLMIYIIVGIVGYLMYGSECTQAILTNFGNDMKEFQGKDNFIIGVLTVINVGFLISSSMTFPLMFFTLKKNFINSIIFCKNKFTTDEGIIIFKNRLQFKSPRNCKF